MTDTTEPMNETNEYWILPAVAKGDEKKAEPIQFPASLLRYSSMLEGVYDISGDPVTKENPLVMCDAQNSGIHFLRKETLMPLFEWFEKNEWFMARIPHNDPDGKDDDARNARHHFYRDCLQMHTNEWYKTHLTLLKNDEKNPDTTILESDIARAEETDKWNEEFFGNASVDLKNALSHAASYFALTHLTESLGKHLARLWKSHMGNDSMHMRDRLRELLVYFGDTKEYTDEELDEKLKVNPWFEPDPEDKPEDEEDKPNDNSGTPNDNSGTPNDNSGTPNDNSGTPNDNSGTPNDNSGTPNDNSGTPNDNSGTPNDNSAPIA